MARNTLTGGRTGVTANRKQTYNPKTGLYVKKEKMVNLWLAKRLLSKM